MRRRPERDPGLRDVAPARESAREVGLELPACLGAGAGPGREPAPLWGRLREMGMGIVRTGTGTREVLVDWLGPGFVNGGVSMMAGTVVEDDGGSLELRTRAPG